MKVLLTGLGPISNKIYSHKAAQAIIYADQLKQAGYDVTINLANNKIADYSGFDEVYVYHGSDWGGSLNLFGGIENYQNVETVGALSRYKGAVKSLIIDFPKYSDMFEARLKKANMLFDWDWNNLRAIESSAQVVDPNLVKRYDRISIGDSHAICMYRPGWMNVSTPFKTLHGAIKLGFDHFIPEGNYKEIEIYFGNIDVRHHLCRNEDVKKAAKDLADRYIAAAEFLADKHSAKVTLWELLPIEDPSRKVPKTGNYKGTPFYGTWQERTDARQYFMDELESSGIPVFKWVDKLKNKKGELDFEYMEKPQSIHLSRAAYPHWQGKEWTEKKEESVQLDAFMV